MSTEPGPESSLPAPGVTGLDRWLASRRGEALLVGALLVVALALRLLYVLDLRANPTFERPVLDGEYHVEWARTILRGGDFYAEKHGQPGPYFRAPLYIWILSFFLRFAEGGLLVPRLFQALFGLATTWLTYLIGKRAFGARTGWIAALGAATYWVLIYFDGELLIETLVVPLDLLALWLTLGLHPRPKKGRAAACGLAWGVSAIARPNVLLLGPCIVLWILWLTRPAWRKGLASAALFGAAFFTPILPITAVNWFHGHDRVLIASQAGVNLWIGNNPMSDGSTAIVPGTRGGWWQGYFDAIGQAEKAEGRELKPSEVSRHYSRKAWEFLRSEPGKALRLFLHKLRIFWIDYELGNNEDVRFVAHHFSWIPRVLPLRFSWLGPLGLLGLVLALLGRERGRLLPLTGFVIVYTAGVVAFFVCSRFRAPILPILIVLASHAGGWLWSALRRREWRGLGLAALVLLPAALLVNVLPAALRRDDSNGYMQLGVAEWNRGNKELAIENLERAVAIKEANSHAQTYLGMFLHDLGRSPEAIQHLQTAVLSDVRNVDALESLLSVYFDTGKYQELERTLVDARRLHPESEIPYYHYGRLRLQQAGMLAQRGDRAGSRAALEDAERAFHEALARAPGSFRGSYALGTCLMQLGRAPEAWPCLQAALARVEEAGAFETPLHLLALQCLKVQQRPAEACELARRWLARRPGEPKARAAVQELCR